MNRTNLTALVSAGLLLNFSGAALAFADGEKMNASESRLDFEIPLENFTIEDPENYAGHQVLIVFKPVNRCGDEKQDEDAPSPNDPRLEAMIGSFEIETEDASEGDRGSSDPSEGGCGRSEGGLLVYSRVSGDGGPDEPGYVYLASIPEDAAGELDWEFRRYLVDRSGSVVTRSGPGVAARDEHIVTAIERLLADPRPGDATVGLVW